MPPRSLALRAAFYAYGVLKLQKKEEAAQNRLAWCCRAISGLTSNVHSLCTARHNTEGLAAARRGFASSALPEMAPEAQAAPKSKPAAATAVAAPGRRRGGACMPAAPALVCARASHPRHPFCLMLQFGAVTLPACSLILLWLACVVAVIDVQSYVLDNAKQYDGDASFLAGPTERTLKLWDEVQVSSSCSMLVCSTGHVCVL
jgi:hypothetical protein